MAVATDLLRDPPAPSCSTRVPCPASAASRRRPQGSADTWSRCPCAPGASHRGWTEPGETGTRPGRTAPEPAGRCPAVRPGQLPPSLRRSAALIRDSALNRCSIQRATVTSSSSLPYFCVNKVQRLALVTGRRLPILTIPVPLGQQPDRVDGRGIRPAQHLAIDRQHRLRGPDGFCRLSLASQRVGLSSEPVSLLEPVSLRRGKPRGLGRIRPGRREQSDECHGDNKRLQDDPPDREGTDAWRSPRVQNPTISGASMGQSSISLMADREKCKSVRPAGPAARNKAVARDKGGGNKRSGPVGNKGVGNKAVGTRS